MKRRRKIETIENDINFDDQDVVVKKIKRNTTEDNINPNDLFPYFPGLGRLLIKNPEFLGQLPNEIIFIIIKYCLECSKIARAFRFLNKSFNQFIHKTKYTYSTFGNPSYLNEIKTRIDVDISKILHDNSINRNVSIYIEKDTYINWIKYINCDSGNANDGFYRLFLKEMLKHGTIEIINKFIINSNFFFHFIHELYSEKCNENIKKDHFKSVVDHSLRLFTKFSLLAPNLDVFKFIFDKKQFNQILLYIYQMVHSLRMNNEPKYIYNGNGTSIFEQLNLGSKYITFDDYYQIVKYGNLEGLRMVLKFKPIDTNQVLYNIITTSIKWNQNHILKWIFSQIDKENGNIKPGSELGDLKIFNLNNQKFSPTLGAIQCTSSITKRNNIEALQLLNEYSIPIHFNIFEQAIRHYNTDIIFFIIKNKISTVVPLSNNSDFVGISLDALVDENMHGPIIMDEISPVQDDDDDDNDDESINASKKGQIIRSIQGYFNQLSNHEMYHDSDDSSDTSDDDDEEIISKREKSLYTMRLAISKYSPYIEAVNRENVAILPTLAYGFKFPISKETLRNIVINCVSRGNTIIHEWFLNQEKFAKIANIFTWKEKDFLAIKNFDKKMEKLIKRENGIEIQKWLSTRLQLKKIAFYSLLMQHALYFEKLDLLDWMFRSFNLAVIFADIKKITLLAINLFPNQNQKRVVTLKVFQWLHENGLIDKYIVNLEYYSNLLDDKTENGLEILAWLLKMDKSFKNNEIKEWPYVLGSNEIDKLVSNKSKMLQHMQYIRGVTGTYDAYKKIMKSGDNKLIEWALSKEGGYSVYQSF